MCSISHYFLISWGLNVGWEAFFWLGSWGVCAIWGHENQFPNRQLITWSEGVLVCTCWNSRGTLEWIVQHAIYDCQRLKNYDCMWNINQTDCWMHHVIYPVEYIVYLLIFNMGTRSVTTISWCFGWFQWYSECSCIGGNGTLGTAIEGPCETDCNKLWVFFPFFLIVIILTFSVYVPGVQITLR